MLSAVKIIILMFLWQLAYVVSTRGAFNLAKTKVVEVFFCLFKKHVCCWLFVSDVFQQKVGGVGYFFGVKCVFCCFKVFFIVVYLVFGRSVVLFHSFLSCMDD